jgi:hypothetical protein
VSRVRELFVPDPPSVEIAARLNAANADVCEHDRNPCYLRCGVRRWAYEPAWVPIRKDDRLAWLERRERDAERSP